ncbi:MAG: glycosyltransferase [Rikenellaceae bacterium]
MSPKISIIIPVYNGEKFLSTCLDSLLAQSLKDIEIICVNDGSKDNSLKVLQEYERKDSRVRAIDQQNKGAGGARNTGMDLASGEFILFIDSDDKVDNDYCEKMYRAAKEFNAEIVVVSMKKVYKNRIKKRFEIKTTSMSNVMQDKFEACGCPKSFYIMNKLFLRESLQRLNIRFDEGICYEDVKFLCLASTQMGLLVSIPDVYYYYINQSNSVTKSKQTPKKQHDRYQALKFCVEYCAEHNIKIEEKYKKITKRYWSFMGLTIMKIKEYDGRLSWRLFDILPIYWK